MASHKVGEPIFDRTSRFVRLMAAFDIPDLKDRGFVGFLPVHGIRVNHRRVPSRPGVYVVARENQFAPLFLDRSPASWFKADPTVPESVLRAEWVEGAQTLYIGSGIDLQDRVGLLVEFSLAGEARSVFHRGGRLLWQLADSQDLLVAWRVEPDGLGTVERDLVVEFKAVYGRFPFANLKLPPVRR